MQRIQFEYSPIFIVLCAALGLGYAFILYRSSYSWPKRVNQLLFFLRTLVVSFLAFLLIGPLLKLTTNLVEKPSLVFLIDNSISVRESIDTIQRVKVLEQLQSVANKLEKIGYSVKWNDLGNRSWDNAQFTNTSSDIHKALQGVASAYEGKNLSGIILLSDGIYNSGTSPLYSSYREPVYSIAWGDTANYKDLKLSDVAYNKITYQGNKFPIRAEVVTQGMTNQEIQVSLYKNGKFLAKQKKNSGKALVNYIDFVVEASEKGIQRLDVVVDPLKEELNIKNNRTSVFVEVINGKKKIVVIAPAPHPDIKALQAVIEKNLNYEFIQYIPGITKQELENTHGNADLIIFHQAQNKNERMTTLFQSYAKGNSSLLYIIGGQSNLRQFNAKTIPILFDQIGQWDEVTPAINPAFRDFTFPDNSNSIMAKYPPVTVPFGKFAYPQNANILLHQRIGSIVTDRPLLMSWQEGNRKVAALVGEGIWKWRLSEYKDTENTIVFDDVFLKLIQYLTTSDDKRKFKSFPLQNEFNNALPVTIESQVYNDLFELIYGNKIALEIQDETGKLSRYEYVLSPGDVRYQIGGLKEGIYQYKSSTIINGKQEVARGQFLVTAQNIETQNLTADFGLLRKLSTMTGGKFYSVTKTEQLYTDFEKLKSPGLIHSEESFNPLINLKWVFFLLLGLISIEWFIRKYLGSY